MSEKAKINPALLARFSDIVGEAHALTSGADKAGYLTEWREKYQGETPLVLLPGSVDEVAEIVRLAQETGTALVPQGGNTGLVGGQLPGRGGSEILISLKRLRAMRGESRSSASLTVEAGVTLAEVQAKAEALGMMFPLSLASEGSCQIGGVISTNAGGIQVLKYGMMRAQVLGLEVVLPSGEIWHGLSDLAKDNTGYDLKQLFIGAEGTLGIITATTLKLVPRPVERVAALVGVRDLTEMARFFAACRAGAHGALSAFEILPRIGLEMVERFREAQGRAYQAPLNAACPYYGLIELEGMRAGLVRPMIEELLSAALEEGVIADGVIAASEGQRLALWSIREEMSEAQKIAGGSIKHDVSVPVAAIPEFIEAANELVERLIPGARPVPFGHFGDGNIHYNISQPEGAEKEAFLQQWERVNEAVYELVPSFNGSISAEHGIGVMKRGLLAETADPVKLALMRQLKAALDPKGIMNPGKVI